jgi:hypothetical protein
MSKSRFKSSLRNLKVREFYDSNKPTRKKCGKCGTTKTIDRFARNRTFPDGFFCWCKDCYNEYQRLQYKEQADVRYKKMVNANKWREENIEKDKDNKQKYFKKTYEDKKDKMFETVRKWRESHRDRNREIARNSYHKRKDVYNPIRNARRRKVYSQQSSDKGDTDDR